MHFRPFYVILDNFRKKKSYFLFGEGEKGWRVSDPIVNFSLIVHTNILKKSPQISAHKSHVNK